MSASRADSRPQFDHLILAVPDPEPVRRQLAEDWGLEVSPDGSAFEIGLANLVVPLEPPQYLELLYVNDADAYARQPDDEAKRRLLAGGGLLGWGLRTLDLAAVSLELGVEFDDDLMLADGSPAPWRSIEKPGSPFEFPFYIQYETASQDRMATWAQRLRAANHRGRIGGIEWVEVAGEQADLEAWLRPASNLGVRIRQGKPSMRAGITVDGRLLTLSSDIVGGVESASR